MEILLLFSNLLRALSLWCWYFKNYSRNTIRNNEQTKSDCYQWNVDQVCQWLTTLGPIYNNYRTSFRSNGINGKILLTEIDANALTDLGVLTGLHRKRILNEINQFNNNINLDIEVELNKPFYKTFHGDFCPPYNLKLLNNSKYKNVLSCDLLNNQTEYSKLISNIYNWIGLLPSGHIITNIEYIFNPIRYRLFLSQLELIENRSTQALFQLDLSNENNLDERLKVLDQLTQLTKQVSHNRNVKIVRMWHGCSYELLPYIISDGFATVSIRDEGWFGRGMYFTSSAKYATQYSGKYGCLIMSYIIILNPFPIITDDAPVHMETSTFRFNGQGNYKTYQCHYAPVAPISYEAKYLDNRPPATGHDDSVFDELVVFQQADILPQIVVHLQREI